MHDCARDSVAGLHGNGGGSVGGLYDGGSALADHDVGEDSLYIKGVHRYCCLQCFV